MIEEHLANPALEAAIRASWSVETCDPADVDRWSTTNPSRGQCGVTALVVNDHLGGRLVMAEVTRHGEPFGYHWWAELPDGSHVDLTRAQFDPDEVVGVGVIRDRPPTAELKRCVEEYLLLAERVGRQLLERSTSRS